MAKFKDQKGPLKPAMNYVVDLGSISPGEMQIEALRYRCEIDYPAQGTPEISYQTPSQRVQPGFYFIMTRIIAGMSEPADNDEVIHLVEFNVMNEGRNKDVFKTPINMSTMLGVGGARMDLVWGEHVGFRFFEGADTIVNWYVDLANWPEELKKNFYVILQGFNVRDLLIPEDSRSEYTG